MQLDTSDGCLWPSLNYCAPKTESSAWVVSTQSGLNRENLQGVFLGLVTLRPDLPASLWDQMGTGFQEPLVHQYEKRHWRTWFSYTSLIIIPHLLIILPSPLIRKPLRRYRGLRQLREPYIVGFEYVTLNFLFSHRYYNEFTLTWPLLRRIWLYAAKPHPLQLNSGPARPSDPGLLSWGSLPPPTLFQPHHVTCPHGPSALGSSCSLCSCCSLPFGPSPNTSHLSQGSFTKPFLTFMHR